MLTNSKSVLKEWIAGAYSTPHFVRKHSIADTSKSEGENSIE